MSYQFTSNNSFNSGIYCSPKAAKPGKYDFNKSGSPIRKVPKTASNESFEELRRAPRKENVPEEIR